MHQSTHARLIDSALACATACEHCASSCLREKDVAMMAECILLDRDCADLCRLVAAFAGRGSRFVPELAAQLARVCLACAEECARHEATHCQACAEACRQCAEMCRSVGAAA
ncbi:four-helix bundle copper-binding protein [Sorangium sp. So ce1128]